jgi:hypothetical protein
MTGQKKASGCLYFGLGCCGCPILVVILVALLAGGAFIGVRFTGPFDEALDRARQSELLREELGEPIKAGLGVSASFNSDTVGSDFKLRIPIEGPEGEALLHAEAIRQGGDWEFLLLEAELPDGSTLNLLEEPQDDVDVI